MAKRNKAAAGKRSQPARDAPLFRVTLTTLVLVPLAFSTAVYRIFALPRLALLVEASSLIAALLLWKTPERARGISGCKTGLESPLVVLATLYLLSVALATAFGVAPVASFFGSFENQMGLVTYACFFIILLSLINGIGASELRLHGILWSMVITGLVVAAYSVAQFFGVDPFLPVSLYTSNSISGPVVRITGTIGHADYLGNFLLYTALVGIGLGIAAKGSSRRIALASSAISFFAIACTGTRGAWLGLLAGTGAFVLLELGGGIACLGRSRKSSLIRVLATFLAVVSVFAWVLWKSDAARAIAMRARTTFSEGLTGSGRTLLWRNALAMAPAYAASGCGPDGFRRAFPAYKSTELAQLAPDTNNESSHNSYLDAAISFGLAGAALYCALITASILLYIRARRRARDSRARLVSTGLLSSFVAVLAHNFFIFDQISTGLYFFAFAALAQAACNVANSKAALSQVDNDDDGLDRRAGFLSRFKMREGGPVWLARLRKNARRVAACALVVLASWYVAALLTADLRIKAAFDSARIGDFDELVTQGERATHAPDLAGDYHFLFARALALLADKIAGPAPGQPPGRAEQVRTKAIKMAMEETEKSVPHTLTPDSNYLLLAYLALASGNNRDLHTYAANAIQLDPKFPNSHWLMGEAWFAEGERERALSESRLALELKPSHEQALSLLARAGGRQKSDRPPVQESLEWASKLLSDGHAQKAEVVVMRILRNQAAPCPECHRLLALIHESARLYDNAIAEWRLFRQQSPEQASRENVSKRIAELTQKQSDSRRR